MFFAFRPNVLEGVWDLAGEWLIFIVIIHFLDFSLQVQKLLPDVYSKMIGCKGHDIASILHGFPIYFGKPWWIFNLLIIGDSLIGVRV